MLALFSPFINTFVRISCYVTADAIMTFFVVRHHGKKCISQLSKKKASNKLSPEGPNNTTPINPSNRFGIDFQEKFRYS